MPAYYKQVLSGATTLGVGMTIMFDSPRAFVSPAVNFQVSFTGAPSAIEVHIEGTLDGIAWTTVMSWNDIGNNGSFTTANISPVIGLRSNLVTLTGGSSPTVDAWLALAVSQYNP